MRLRVALLQMAGQGSDQAANLAKGEIACRQAAARGADIALFPEMWNIAYSGYDHAAEGAMAAWIAQAIPRDGPFVRHFRQLARELNMAIALTYLERRDGPPGNAVALIDRHGRIALAYAKVHTCDFDVPEVACARGSDFFTATLGTKTGPAEVGAMICMDREYPESARLLMLKGAEIVLTPNACLLATCPVFGDARLAQFRTRALENLIGVAMANYPAPQCDGHSVAYGADGAPIVAADASEGIWLADFDLDKIRALRRDDHFRLRYQRPVCYRPLGPGCGAPFPLRRSSCPIAEGGSHGLARRLSLRCRALPGARRSHPGGQLSLLDVPALLGRRLHDLRALSRRRVRVGIRAADALPLLGRGRARLLRALRQHPHHA
jgi:N-carbamoylputrescine amidase